MGCTKSIHYQHSIAILHGALYHTTMRPVNNEGVVCFSHMREKHTHTHSNLFSTCGDLVGQRNQNIADDVSGRGDHNII